MQRTQMALIGALLVGAMGVFVWRAKQHSSAPEEPHSTLPVASAPFVAARSSALIGSPSASRSTRSIGWPEGERSE